MNKKIPKDVLQQLVKPVIHPYDIIDVTDREEIIGRRYVKSKQFYSQIVIGFETAEIGQTSEFCGVIAAITGKTIERIGRERMIFVTVDFYDKV